MNRFSFLKKVLIPTIILLISTIFYGCGGGGGGGGGTKTDTTAAAGVWVGTATDINHITTDLAGLVSTDGQLRFVVDSGECRGTQYKGTISLDGDTGSGTITGYVAPGCLFGNGETTTTGTINFTFSNSKLTGTYSVAGDSGSFDLNYESIAEIPITLDDLKGSWGYDFGPDNFFQVTVASNGSFTGTSSLGCNFSGNLSIIDSDWSITKVSASTSNCDDPAFNGTWSGLGLLRYGDPDIFLFIISKPGMSFYDGTYRLGVSDCRLATLSDIEGTWEVINDYGAAGVDIMYQVQYLNGNYTVYDYAGDSFDNYGDCYWVDNGTVTDLGGGMFRDSFDGSISTVEICGDTLRATQDGETVVATRTSMSDFTPICN